VCDSRVGGARGSVVVEGEDERAGEERPSMPEDEEGGGRCELIWDWVCDVLYG